ncbi:MAG: response regulator transcription factor, partial [Syntrophomonadaceae bacterium]|nr:response regulator transcription factor [Syntrophomonadaceae bacterium]
MKLVKQRVLVVDDDREIVKAIAINLQNEGYEVVTAYDGLQALDIVSTQKVHLIILDVMMPRLDGLSTTMKIRAERNIPIIILSAKSEDTDKVLGLSMGADDYVTKPFNRLELMARVKSQLRRYLSLGDVNVQSRPNLLQSGGLCFDPESHTLMLDGEL